MEKITKLSLNFSDLKLSLSQIGIVNKNETDCIKFLRTNFNSNSLPSLKSLEVEAIEIAENNGIYAVQEINLLHGTLRMLHIRNTQDLRMNVLNLVKFTHLTHLSITNCRITLLPASVGKMEHLKSLILSRNQLSSLPYFIVYCGQLEELDLSFNQFQFLPGYIQQLPKLKTLRRLNNPLVEEVKGWRLDSVSIYKFPSKITEESSFVPPLQTLCLPVIIRTQPNYWDLPIAPSLCRMLDHNAELIIYCENCYKPGYKPDVFILSSVIFRCYELSFVPFGHYSCSRNCNGKIEQRVLAKTREIQNNWNREYDAMVRSHNHLQLVPQLVSRPKYCEIL